MTSDQERRDFWPVVLACFCIAVFSWGFGFYGQAVYLAELHRLRGWPTTLLSTATTCFYLGSACLLPFVHRVMAAFGRRWVLLGGIAMMALGASAYSRAAAPWQLFAAGGVMAVGWAGASGPAIATALSFWFDQRRGLAISLALNGASASAFTVAPVLVRLSQSYGLTVAVPMTALVGCAIAGAVVLFGVRRPPVRQHAPNPVAANGKLSDIRTVLDRPAAALRNRHFWSVALPFALGTGAQVGFIVHMVAILLPQLGSVGTSAAVSAVGMAAMVGRLGLGTVIDRLPRRPVSAVSFVSQAAGMGLILGFPALPWALFAGCILFGLSVGNVITLPAILIQREFAARSFGMIVGLSGAIVQFTLALGPALFGLLRDLSGDYRSVLMLCIALQLASAALVSVRIRIAGR